MSKVAGIFSKLSGTIGEVVFGRNQNKTYAYEKPDVKVSKSKQVVRQRMRWMNPMNLYRYCDGLLKNAFNEVKETKQSSFNYFMKVNASSEMPSIYFTKDEAKQKAAIVAPYIVSEGELESIKMEYSNGTYVTNLSMGTLQVTAETTIAQFTVAITQANPRVKVNDQLMFIAVEQITDDDIPKVKVYNCSIVLDYYSTDKVWTNSFRQRVFQTENGKLVAKLSFEGGCTYCLLRALPKNSSDEKTSYSVSKQTLCCNNPLIATYSTNERFERAAASYGGYEEVFFSHSASHTEIIPEETTTTVTITAKVASGQDAMGTVQAGSSAAGATSSVTVAKNTSVELKAVANTGYHFKQWNDGSTQATISVVADATATYTATFEADTPTGNVTVTLTSENVSKGKVQINGGEQGATATATVTYGSSVTIKAISVAGYDFLKWSDNNQNYERTLTPTENVSLTAYFEEE